MGTGQDMGDTRDTRDTGGTTGVSRAGLLSCFWEIFPSPCLLQYLGEENAESPEEMIAFPYKVIQI